MSKYSLSDSRPNAIDSSRVENGNFRKQNVSKNKTTPEKWTIRETGIYNVPIGATASRDDNSDENGNWRRIGDETARTDIVASPSKNSKMAAMEKRTST